MSRGYDPNDPVRIYIEEADLKSVIKRELVFFLQVLLMTEVCFDDEQEVPNTLSFDPGMLIDGRNLNFPYKFGYVRR